MRNIKLKKGDIIFPFEIRINGKKAILLDKHNYVYPDGTNDEVQIQKAINKINKESEAK